MLLQFSVKNYLSYRDEKVLSMIPSSDKEHMTHIIKNGKYKALNVITIYGANATGKTALFKAMTIALNIIRNSNSRQFNQAIPVVPFLLDDTSRNEPTSFEFQFVGYDDKKYIYGFSARQDRFTEEYLYCYNTNRPTKVFDRIGDSYTYSRLYEKELKQYEKMNTSNKLFLCTATNWNAEATKAPYQWLSEGIDSFTDISSLQGAALFKYKMDVDNGIRDNLSFAEELLKQADINISQIDFSYKEVDQDDGVVNMLPKIVINDQVVTSQNNIRFDIAAQHIEKDESGISKSYSLPLSEESMGTQLMFLMGPLLKETFDRGKVLVIDEIDKSLHPLIVEYLIKLFSKYSNNGAQLIVTTHDTSQMSLKKMRRDQIYFTEKNNSNGVSDLYSLDDFELPVRKTENVEKGYLLGRYGAIPLIHTEGIE